MASVPAAAQKKPNIVMLMTDDTGWNDQAKSPLHRALAVRALDFLHVNPLAAVLAADVIEAGLRLTAAS
jgi:hypothetical protein